MPTPRAYYSEDGEGRVLQESCSPHMEDGGRHCRYRLVPHPTITVQPFCTDDEVRGCRSVLQKFCSPVFGSLRIFLYLCHDGTRETRQKANFSDLAEQKRNIKIRGVLKINQLHLSDVGITGCKEKGLKQVQGLCLCRLSVNTVSK